MDSPTAAVGRTIIKWNEYNARVQLIRYDQLSTSYIHLLATVRWKRVIWLNYLDSDDEIEVTSSGSRDRTDSGDHMFCVMIALHHHNCQVLNPPAPSFPPYGHARTWFLACCNGRTIHQNAQLRYKSHSTCWTNCGQGRLGKIETAERFKVFVIVVSRTVDGLSFSGL